MVVVLKTIVSFFLRRFLNESIIFQESGNDPSPYPENRKYENLIIIEINAQFLADRKYSVSMVVPKQIIKYIVT